MTVAVVFDLDGVIWDLRPHVAAVMGLDEPAVRRHLSGGGNVVALARRQGISAAALGRRISSRPGVVTAEVHETLRELHGEGCYVAAATSLSRRIAQPIIRAGGLDSLLERVVCPGGGRRSKPAPDSLLAAVDGVTADEHWYVGDTPTDLAAARAAGWHFAWATYGYGPRPQAKVDAEIDSITQLPDVLALP